MAASIPPDRRLFLIDAIGPFFRGYDRVRINWSKIPWRRFEKLDPADRRVLFAQIRDDLAAFVEKAAATGFTAVSLDDVPHLADHEAYEPRIRAAISENLRDFRPLFAACRDAGVEVYLTMDVMSWTPALRERVRGESEVNAFLIGLFERFFKECPEIAGVIIRIGESDGLDVKDDFRSDLHLRNPGMVSRFLRSILPVFEKHGRDCVFRTWTVGAHQVGDLIWRDSTLAMSLAGVESPSLILSMKHGESDFFRYLPANRNFFVTPIQKIVEIQTRREYEGAGEYPSFMGWENERLARELEGAPGFIGIMAWCQTGGWHPFRRLTWVENSSVWTEIDTHSALRVFKHRESVETAIAAFHGVDPGRAAEWIELLRLSSEVVSGLLYLPEFARQSFYFRRVRIPPLIGVYWHTLFVNPAIRRVLEHFMPDGESSIQAGQAEMEKFPRMKALAAGLGLPVSDIEYMERTYALFALAREYHFRPGDSGIEARLKAAKKAYKRLYPRGSRYRHAVKLDFESHALSPRYLRWFVALCIRGRHRYRLVDRVVSLSLLPLLYSLVKRTRPKMIPKFARKSAMGIDAIFR